MYKKNITLGIIIIFLSIFLSSCASTISRNNQKAAFLRNSFLKLEKTLEVVVCSEKEQSCTPLTKMGSTASGSVIKNRFDGSYILTAAHVCDDSKIKQFVQKMLKESLKESNVIINSKRTNNPKIKNRTQPHPNKFGKF